MSSVSFKIRHNISNKVRVVVSVVKGKDVLDSGVDSSKLMYQKLLPNCDKANALYIHGWKRKNDRYEDTHIDGPEYYSSANVK